MGKIGKCCCAEGECCICDEAWAFTGWSVGLLGKTFTGSFIPSAKPDPFTVENGCQSRQGGHCIVDDPTILLDCVEEGSWGSTFLLVGGLCCPQCICYDYGTTSQIISYCEHTGSFVNWQYQSKGVTHSRAWQQESWYGVAQMLCCDSPANSVRFSFDFYYHVARFAATSSQAFRRFRSVTFDCIYEPGIAVTEIDNVVYGDWVQPVSVGSKPPCLPCDWEQSDFFGNCSTLNSDCPPCEDIFNCNEVVTYDMDYRSITCDFFSLNDFSDDGIPICEIPDEAPYIFEGTVTSNAYVGSTAYCSDPLYSFGTNCTVDPSSAVIEHRFLSDCIPCDEIPCEVTLDRITGGSLGSSIEVCVLGADADCSCGAISQVCKTIPASITMTLTPCT